MCTNESLNNKHDIRIKWVRKFGVCRTSYTSFGKFGTPKTNGRAPKTRFLVKSVQKKYKLSNTNGPPRFTKLNYTVLWVYYTGCTRKIKKKRTPAKAAAIRLTLLLFPMCTKPRVRYQNSESPSRRNRSRFASRSNCTHIKEISSPQYHIYTDNTFRACGKDSPNI